MNKAKGVRLIRGREPLRKLAIVHVEHETGELYWDRMGRVIRQLHRSDSAWMREGKVTQNKTTIVNAAEEVVLEVSPAATLLALNYERHPSEIDDDRANRFGKLAVAALGVVTDELEIESFQRVSFREFYYFPGPSTEDTEMWIRNLGLVSISDKVHTNFGREFFALSYVVIVVGEECRYRIEVKGVERVAEVPAGQADVSIKESHAKRKNKEDLLRLLKEQRDRTVDPLYTAVVDIDAFLWDDTETDFDLEGFISERVSGNLNLFRACVAEETGQ